MTRVGSMNEKDTIPLNVARADLENYLRKAEPDVVCLQEWGKSRDQILNDLKDYDWARPAAGGGPILWRKGTRRLKSCKAIRLARSEFVGHLPGRRSRLGASIATEVVLEVLDGGPDEAYLNYHFTAEVQVGAGYRRDLKHRLRVMRHKRERRRLARRGRMHVKRGRRTRLCGDGNFEGMRLKGFISCWERRAGGTLGSRAVDIVFDTKPAKDVETYKTRSDHRAICVEERP